MKILQACAIVCALTTTLVLPAHSAIVSFATPEAYNAATTSTGTVSFSNHKFAQDYGNGVGLTFVGSSGTFGGVTFQEAQDRLFVLSDGYYADNMGGNYLNNNAGGDIVTMSFTAPITAFALDFGTIYNWGGGSFIETFTFADVSQSFTLPGESYDHRFAPSFVGFTSDKAFTSVSINDPTHGLAIRDVTFGNATATDVPEPSALALMALGLMSLAMSYRRSR